jgi:two-component system response regulator WspF
MRVGVAHESSGVVAALRQVVASIKGWQVAWVESTGEAAIARCQRDRPDLLLLSPDVGEPGLAEATRRIMRGAPCVVVVVARDSRAQAAAVFEAMGAGAVDAVAAPAVGEDGRLSGLEEIARRLKRSARLVTHRADTARRSGFAPVAPLTPVAPLVAIGASTGGPAAVAAVLSALPVPLDASVVVVQHVDAQFAANLAAWLGGHTRLEVALAVAGGSPRRGVVVVTGANDDLTLTSRLEFAYRRPRDGTFYHPSVDVFFESVAAHWPGPGVAVLLTGIGRDGAEGLLALRRKGWHTIAQDERSSVVYGMPRAAAELNAAVEILPIERIGAAILRALGARGTDKRGTRG